MTLTDQQLRQELINYGETVPPITQRNREQLRARLEILRSQTRTRSHASPSRSQTTASPSRSQAAASPSRTTRTSAAAVSASPSRTQVAASPSRTTRATASPSHSLATSSPSRTRTSATTPTGESRRTTRSQQPSNLIELSDSETDSSTGVLMSRSLRAGQTTPNLQTRSIALRRQTDSPTTISSISDTGASANITDDVEQSIARHRREIKQLLDSARDRNRATDTSISSHSVEQQERKGTPIRSSSKSRTHQQPLKINDDDDDDEDKTDKVKRSPKSDKDEQKKSPSFKHIRRPIQSFWGKNLDLIKNIFKFLIVSSLLIGAAIFLLRNYDEFFIPNKAINCSVKNATQCEEMAPVITAVRKQLQIRTGEVDCGFRNKTDILVTRPEIERYLNEKGLKFNLGNEERWKALVTYILDKPLKDILVWNERNQETKNIAEAKKLSTPEALRALTCRVRQDASKTFRNLILLILGSTGLLTLAWYLQKQSKTHEENERTYHNLLEKAKKLVEEQYEKHIQDPNAQPWLAISHIREKLISKEDQDKLKNIWERVKKQITKEYSRISSETQEINGENSDVWRWLKSSPKKNKSEPLKSSNEESNGFMTSEVGLTECLKLRNCFRSDNYADDEEIDHVIESIRNRCASIERIEHIGIHSVFVYLKFSSKEAAGKAYDLLNNWKYENRTINVKYIRLNRYHEHFPDARNASPKK
ncbi:unnamed protein product [Rotaria sordida]|uniref:LEM domain-containing protein n=1 Tax=Rotaria sordida TaxID=392033 RepID=A0A814A3E1_9BILA|nr:unnamed protein product [Rotaria sordida]CAF3555374.1 unnamed protein product [Rotaria sordida]